MGRIGRLIVLVVVILMVSCAKDRKDASQGAGVAAGGNKETPAVRDRFETAEDPPLTADTHFWAGQLAESQNNAPAAIEQYKKALKADEKHQPSLYRLGVLYCQAKEYPQAIAAWKTYLKASDNSAVGYGNLGFCYELAGEPKEAQAAYKKGIEKDPGCVLCRNNYGLMLVREGRAQEALEQMQTVMSPAEAHYNLGSVYEQQGRIPEARAEFGKSLELDPKFSAAAVRLAKLQTQ